MNKSFKVVFSKARGALMVVNELTSSVQAKGTKTVVAAAVAAAVKHHAAHKAASLHIVIELAGDIARKILSAARARIVLVHVGAQITVQRALRLFIGSLIKVAGICFSQ